LDPAYFAHRLPGEVTGFEAGTPFMAEMEAVEIFNNWSFEQEGVDCESHEGEAASDDSLCGRLSEDIEFVPRDSSAFAFNKWDSALSRGNRLWVQLDPVRSRNRTNLFR